MITVDLQCQDPIIYELMQEEDVNPYQLISAQLQVVKSMEETWCANALMASGVILNVILVGSRSI